ncbi:WXG100 family type VII secretion target [Nocardia sp. CA-084685]|uniref:WXG100 family type VII secretion target n=1 Tax=Nocardia sp. CA-084685 TaxID=3239970 RepID=UPI003D995C18
MSYATDNSSIMQYSPGHIEALLGELRGFKTALVTSQGDASSADTAITNVWQGASAQAYHTAFSAVSQNLDDVINVLQQGIDGVEEAHNNAQTTDGRVMKSFMGS